MVLVRQVHNEIENGTGPAQYERVKTFFDDIKSQDWDVAVGGEMNSSPGYFITPSVIDRPPENSRIVAGEPFGE